MITGNLSSRITGWVAIATGVSAILALVFIALMYTVSMVYGAVNDVFNGIIGISSAVLAWMLFATHHAKSPLLSRLALASATVGAVLTVIGSILVIYEFTGFILAGWYTQLGNALIGLWLVAFCCSMRRGDALPHNLIKFGLVVGAFMTLGLIGVPGIVAGIDDYSMESMPLYLYIPFLGFLGTYYLYPIWTIWLGRKLLLQSSDQKIP